jgi:hypothetical protein
LKCWTACIRSGYLNRNFFVYVCHYPGVGNSGLMGGS